MHTRARAHTHTYARTHNMKTAWQSASKSIFIRNLPARATRGQLLSVLTKVEGFKKLVLSEALRTKVNTYIYICTDMYICAYIYIHTHIYILFFWIYAY